MTDIPRARRDLVALTVLTMLAEQPRHPYEMHRLIRDRRKGFVTGLPRSLYHAVDRLLAAGLIEPVETSREGNRPERTVYQITDEGRAEMDSWLSELLAIPASEHPLFTAALSLLVPLSPSAVLQCLRIRAASLEGEIATIDIQLRAVTEQLPRIFLLEEEFARAMRQAELDWVRALIEDIEAGRLSWDLEHLLNSEASSVVSRAPRPHEEWGIRP